MIVLGIDPGIAITGVSIVSDEKGKQALLYSTAITTSQKDDTARRLLHVFQQIAQVISSHHPDVASMEKLFFNTNVTTAMTVGQARGVILLALAQRNIPLTEYTPLQVKMAITGYGRAEKQQIQMMVKQILKLPTILKPDDVADSAAIALTHCFSYKLTNSIK